MMQAMIKGGGGRRRREEYWGRCGVGEGGRGSVGGREGGRERQ